MEFEEQDKKNYFDKERDSIKDAGVKWLLSQPFTNVLLVVLIVMIAWGGHYSITIAIPQHLKSIQDGYEKIDTAARMERKELRSQYESWFMRGRTVDVD